MYSPSEVCIMMIHWMYDEPIDTKENRYRYNGKEYSKGSRLSDYGARYYAADIGRWAQVDPLADQAPGWTPYRYGFNNPVRYTDPTGLFEDDPIHDRKGNVIGDDGKTDGKAYLATGRVARDVKKATKAGEFYTGSLDESDKVFKIPTGGVMDDVISSVNDTEKSQKENGGHANIGDANATRWDEGPAAIPFVDKDGNQGVKATLTMFKINGKNEMPTDASNVEFWWHTHPNTTVNGLTLGNSYPTDADFIGQTTMANKGYKGNSFVVGVRTGTVTFFNAQKALITVKYSDFKTMGGK